MTSTENERAPHRDALLAVQHVGMKSPLSDSVVWKGSLYEETSRRPMERAPSELLKQGNIEAFHRKIKNNTEYLTTLSRSRTVH
ncbi:MAG: hypothetical protein KFB95_05290 [Simkaniaceae bacterium]|nr:MAG: hypothetical protein KFB95_05290 [Simkaniaceae bacterium]